MTEKLPLRDVRIVDLTMGWAGPLATRHLADMGAEVIKIEACSHPDWWRGWEHSPEALASREHEKNPSFNMINRNKLGVAIELTKPEGRALALKLVVRADAVIENQATGVLDKLGLSYEELREANPEIIMLSLPAFGALGPWSGYRGYGSTVEQGAGLPHLTGGPDDPPMMTHVAYGDACGGLNAAAALLVALFHRKRTGRGQRIDLSQVEAMLQQGLHGPITQGLTGAPPPRTGNRHPVYAPHGVFACAEPDSWLVVAVTDDGQWPALCQVMGRPDLGADPNLATAAGRRAGEDAIEAAMAAWTGAMEADIAMRALQESGVPAGVTRRPSDLVTDPDYLERGFWRDLERQVVGVKPHPQTPWRFNGERGPLRSPSPLLGEHNHDVLGGILGLGADEIAALEAAGIVGDRPVAPG
jgi:crotonobetainyl-CoA:carnitine CoA-transferase CaiB-like acyl-CoA transferase